MRARLMEHPLEAILFDMDGVITDTHQSVTQFWLTFAAEKGVTLTADDFERYIYGRPDELTLQALFPMVGEAEKAALASRMQEYEIHLTYEPIPGAVELLRTLQAHGVRTALVTSGEHWKVDAVLGQLGITDAFTTCVTAADIPRGKPDPACYRLAAGRLGVQPERCVVFEDALSGAQAALAAGTVCVGVQQANRAAGLLALGVRCVVPDLRAVTLQEGALQIGGQYQAAIVQNAGVDVK